MKINDTVQVIEKIATRDYTAEGQILRLKFAGKTGRIIKEHNGHGLCYEVKFSKGIAYYDLDEFRVLTKQSESEKFIGWLKKSLMKATSIHDAMEKIPASERTPNEHNKMVSNGGKMTILKNTLDYLKKHPRVTLVKCLLNYSHEN